MGLPLIETERLEDRLPINVFVVSPNATLRQEVEGKLALPRWKVLQTGSGAGALELLRQHETGAGVLLLDPMLPDLDANEFHGIVRDRNVNFPIAIIVRNGYAQALQIGRASCRERV